jgi:hypothetical protein
VVIRARSTLVPEFGAAPMTATIGDLGHIRKLRSSVSTRLQMEVFHGIAGEARRLA